MHENWNRYYDPVPGVYLSIEPLHRVPMFAQAQARQGHAPPAYAYALNNPLQFIDPDGRDAINNSRVNCQVKPEGGDWRPLPGGGRYNGNVDAVACENGNKLAISGYGQVHPFWQEWSIDLEPWQPQPDIVVEAGTGKLSCTWLEFVFEKTWPNSQKHPGGKNPYAP